MALRAFGHYDFEDRGVIDGPSQSGPLEIDHHADAAIAGRPRGSAQEAGRIASAARQRSSGRSSIAAAFAPIKTHAIAIVVADPPWFIEHKVLVADAIEQHGQRLLLQQKRQLWRCPGKTPVQVWFNTTSACNICSLIFLGASRRTA